MWNVFKVIGLGLTLIPAVVFFFDGMSHDALKMCMLMGMVVWFAAAIGAARSEV